MVQPGAQLAYQPKTHALQHEVELVVALGQGGANVTMERAPSLIFGYAVGLDLTRRDLQAEAKKRGRPWEMGKGFDQSAPIGALTRAIPPAAGAISLKINGLIKQSGDLTQMNWGVAEIIAILSSYVTLAPGDLIFTGTPAGVGPLRRSDALLAELVGTEPLAIGVSS